MKEAPLKPFLALNQVERGRFHRTTPGYAPVFVLFLGTAAIHGSVDDSQVRISSSSLENDSPVFVSPPSGINCAFVVPAPHDYSMHFLIGESAMEIEGPAVGSEEVVSSCTIPEVVSYIKNVKNVRAFGLLLKIDSGRLDEIEKSSAIIDSRTQIVQEWFKSVSEMSAPDRWEELGNILLQPAIDEPAIAIRLKPHLRRGSSVDSAISVFSRSGSISSPISPSPYQISYLGKFIIAI